MIARLAEVTVRLGFANVIDAFHIGRDGQPTQTPFFVDERSSRQGITLTDHLLALANGVQSSVLPLEVDARWNLVQTSWGLGLGTRVVSAEITPDEEAVDLYVPARLRRGPITGVRDALSGYQDGRCAYCNELFTDIGTKRVAVDHVLPFVLMTQGWADGDLHQIWNFVLACYACNSAKRDRPPAADLDALAGKAKRAPDRFSPSPTRDLDHPARPGSRPQAPDPSTAPHRGDRDDPALETARELIERVAETASSTTGIVTHMTVQPVGHPDPAEPYEVIHLGGEAAAIVPLPELRRLRAVDGMLPRKPWKRPRSRPPSRHTMNGSPPAPRCTIARRRHGRTARQRPVKIEWSPAATALARQYMHDQAGMRAIGVAVTALASDPYPSEAFHRGRYHRLTRRPVPGGVHDRR